LNTRIITQPAKFCKVPDKAIPIAKPAAANIATKELVSTHIIQAALMKTSIFKIIVTKLEMNDLSIGSSSALFIAFKNPLFIRFTILNQIHNTKIAQNIFGI
jgi:hypothetical protein